MSWVDRAEDVRKQLLIRLLHVRVWRLLLYLGSIEDIELSECISNQRKIRVLRVLVPCSSSLIRIRVSSFSL
jgi:hypothetical protein